MKEIFVLLALASVAASDSAQESITSLARCFQECSATSYAATNNFLALSGVDLQASADFINAAVVRAQNAIANVIDNLPMITASSNQTSANLQESVANIVAAANAAQINIANAIANAIANLPNIADVAGSAQQSVDAVATAGAVDQGVNIASSNVGQAIEAINSTVPVVNVT